MWWITNEKEEEEITGWEIRRYRRDLNGKAWSLKGNLNIKAFSRKQIMIENLTNGYEYRFTVCSINSQGVSAESNPSNTVIIEAMLPIGWFRFYDKKVEKFYYANLKTKQSSWTRPDLSPDFLDEEIVFHFDKKELSYARELFDEVYLGAFLRYVVDVAN